MVFIDTLPLLVNRFKRTRTSLDDDDGRMGKTLNFLLREPVLTALPRSEFVLQGAYTDNMRKKILDDHPHRRISSV